ncbi:P-loop containing nucleoside triphosphate hydrolase protein [Aspergillus japonicus CBS 114.51]|uniref:Kinesin-like protein n=1 Tax=Aspergillus japonicus CBS 114.51 TaxID=1448312 RepID=A0A8T8X5L0_ASPJA|nr:P-loop containing nucleoside triphosphate hydrolase protein [Aspergillus japonicus CBS 114.51]RAH83194.1 P-loop containing nucleoside triphosphate hydrolase protein [Aspergillus japonicus CBS 114.51]
MQPCSVFVRWRPLPPDASDPAELTRNYEPHPSHNRISISLPPQSPQARPWKSSHAFTHIFESSDTNRAVFDAVVAPTLPRVLTGGTSTVFAYGHSGSGKSHTIIGYDFEHREQYGLCLAAAQHLLDALHAVNTNTTDKTSHLGLGLRMYELRGNAAFDLLNDHSKCHIREGGDGKTHVRGETEVLEHGRVRVRPIATKACWSFDEFLTHLRGGLALRATGSSTVHDLSSRTHAVLEVEIVSRALLAAREAVVERESDFVPVAKRATDVYLEESLRGLVKDAEGKYVPNPEYQVNQARIDAAEAKKAEFQGCVDDAVRKVEEVLRTASHFCLGGKLVLVDLAGSEFYHDKTIAAVPRPKLSPQEQREGRQINTDLLALKEVIRARAARAARIPYRSSPLTMVLREHFQGTTGQGADACSRMILTVSPALGQGAATANTLKYGSLVGGLGPGK